MHKTISKVLTGLVMIGFFTIAVSQQISAQDSNLLEMVEVRTTDSSNNAEAEQMIDRLDNVDSRILYETNRSGVSIILMDVPLTELSEFQHLSGTVPRGWEGSGNTWDDVPGAGGFTTAARIGYSDPGNGHSTINLELHEYAHAVDSYTAGFTFSEDSAFRQIMADEKDALFGDHAVSEYFDVPSEYFAEAFAMYYLGGEEQNKLQSRAPQTYNYMETLNYRIISFGEITGNTMTIEWDEYDGADSYNIYQNGEQVANVSEGEYEAGDLETNTNYEYYVEALDSNETPLFTSFFRYATTSAEPDENGAADRSEVDDSKLEEAVNQAVEIPESERTDELQEALDEARMVLEESREGDVEEQSEVDDARDGLLSAIEQNDMEEERPEEDISEIDEDASSGEETESAEDSGTAEEPAESEESSEMEETVESEEETVSDQEETATEEADEGETEEVETDEESAEVENTLFDGNTFIIIAIVILVILAVVSAVLVRNIRK
ncbi:anthrax toxin lethal factor-related metalloendopeptidase [Lacicoccus alkaliphilus]|uniref:ATLF-like domain-containing protein n=1 Tax=Lacicoccus alkaliphilus DSM 16010 TaxID=1123231 RepID=A0A1M7IK92_9BACL|nr:hypothetical protein [Salinicoccus alkaliphilus]SHM41204.1 hypothetical protein SAMN02745189_02124 [Salinicoccus alkaliphilus DSM 16010]